MPKGTLKVSPHSETYGDPHKTDTEGVQLVSIDGTPTVSAGENATTSWIKLTTSTTQTVEVVAAQGGATAIEIRGFMISNGGANMREFHIRFAAATKIAGYAAADGGAWNWNMIGGYPKTAVNEAINVYDAMSGNTTALICVLWKQA